MSNLPRIHHMTVYKNTTETISFTLTNLPTTLSSAVFTMKKTVNDSTAIFTKTLNDGISTTGDGHYTVRIAPDDTVSDSILPGEYVYDLKIEYGSDKKVLISGKINLVKGVSA